MTPSKGTCEPPRENGVHMSLDTDSSLVTSVVISDTGVSLGSFRKSLIILKIRVTIPLNPF